MMGGAPICTPQVAQKLFATQMAERAERHAPDANPNPLPLYHSGRKCKDRKSLHIKAQILIIFPSRVIHYIYPLALDLAPYRGLLKLHRA